MRITMKTRHDFLYGFATAALLGGLVWIASISGGEGKKTEKKKGIPDAVAEAQTPRDVKETRPEQKKTKHDLSDIFKEDNQEPSSPALNDQPEKGRMNGFDFFRDALGAMKPKGKTFEQAMKEDMDAKPKIMAAHKQLLEKRY